MSKRKRARALHRWEPAHSEKLRKFDLGRGREGRRHLVITDRPRFLTERRGHRRRLALRCLELDFVLCGRGARYA
jgi:hypothetical protein